MMRSWMLAMVAACGGASQGSPDDGDQPEVDAAVPEIDAPIDAAVDAPIDAPRGPSGVECFYDWASLECGPPVISAAFLTDNCQGTTGVFVVGHGLQSANRFMVDNGWLAYGPRALSKRWNGEFWNFLTPNFMCVTTSADPGTWSGFDIRVQNPDGQTSNKVTVQNLLGARPPFESTGSADPFDPNACVDAGMTQTEALATFQAGASTSTLGTIDVMSRARACNTATGCQPWGASTQVQSGVEVGLAIVSGKVHFTLGEHDCGRLGENDRTLTYNSCPDYEVHVAARCLAASSTVRSPIDGDGNYVQTDAAALLRY